MKVLKRIGISILRKPLQMIVMFLIVFVLGNVLFASIAVKQSSEQVKEEMLSRIEGKILIQYDIENLQWTISFEKAKKMNHLYQELKHNEELKIDIMSDLCVDRICLFGVSNYNDLLGEMNIVSGKGYTQDHWKENKHEIVVNYFSLEGEYQVGDMFQVPIYDYEIITVDNIHYARPFIKEYVEYKIIGMNMGYHFYNEKSDFEPYKGTPVFYHSIPYSYIEELVQKQQELLSKHSPSEQAIFADLNENSIGTTYELNPVIRGMRIRTKGVEAVNQLEQSIRKNDYYASALYTLVPSTAELRYIQAPIENLVALADVAFYASSFLIVLILSLVSTFFIKNRVHEIGILMALGERKTKIFGQFVGEILLVGLLATSVAMVSGNKLGSMISNEFMRIQIDSEGEKQYQIENGDVLTQLDVMDSYKVEITMEYILTIYAFAIVVLILSSGMSLIFIHRLNPKEILLEN